MSADRAGPDGDTHSSFSQRADAKWATTRVLRQRLRARGACVDKALLVGRAEKRGGFGLQETVRLFWSGLGTEYKGSISAGGTRDPLERWDTDRRACGCLGLAGMLCITRGDGRRSLAGEEIQAAWLTFQREAWRGIDVATQSNVLCCTCTLCWANTVSVLPVPRRHWARLPRVRPRERERAGSNQPCRCCYLAAEV
jgi:hypothetical protein